MNGKKLIKIGCRVLWVAAFWIGLWFLIAWRVGKPLLFPSPASVLQSLWELMQTKAFYQAVGKSLWNVLSGCVLAVLCGVLLAFLTWKLTPVRDLLFPLMNMIKATPVASFIILALLMLGAERVPRFITFLIVLPVVWTNTDTGLRSIDRSLSEMAEVFRIPLWRRVRFLILPSVRPYLLSACHTSLGLAWKAGIAAEIITMPRGTIGTMIGDAKQYILTSEMFAWTLTVVLLSLFLEFLMGLLFRLSNAKRKNAERRKANADSGSGLFCL